MSTPETGIDSIGITYALMGLPMTIARPIAAIFSAIVTGFSIAVFGRPEQPKSDKSVQPTSSCCHSAKAIEPVEAETKSCCTSEQVKTNNIWDNTKAIFAYGFGQLLVDFMKWLLIGLFFAALVLTYVPENWMASYGSGLSIEKNKSYLLALGYSCLLD